MELYFILVALSISKVLEFIGHTPRSLDEGGQVYKVGHIMCIAATTPAFPIQVYASVLQTSALFGTPHKISVLLEQSAA